jgi:hypothetical protein
MSGHEPNGNVSIHIDLIHSFRSIPSLIAMALSFHLFD